MNDLRHFKFWCQKVLPLVYDNSLSYYEVLCKVVKYINDLIADNRIMANEISELQNELKVVQEWIDNFDTKTLEKYISEYLMSAIFLAINDEGYIVYYIPESWDDIEFNTTNYDIIIPDFNEYGHLVLSY